jgi:hypothetical protein
MTDLSTAVPTSAETWPAAPESDDDRLSSAPTDNPPAEPVSTVLARLAASGWRTLEGRVSNDSLRIAIDHIAIGPGGIFAIDSHSFASSGPDFSVISDANQPAKLAAAKAVADTIRALLPPLTRHYVVSVIAYVDHSPMSMSRGPIQICTTSMLHRVVTARRSVLSSGEIDDVFAALDSALPSSGSPAPRALAPAASPPASAAPVVRPPTPGGTPEAKPRRGRRFFGRRESTPAPTLTPPATEPASTDLPPMPAVPYTGAVNRSKADQARSAERAANQRAARTRNSMPEPEPELLVAPTTPVIPAAPDDEPGTAHAITSTIDSAELTVAAELDPVDEPTSASAVIDDGHRAHDDTMLTDYFRQLRDTDRLNPERLPADAAETVDTVDAPEIADLEAEPEGEIEPEIADLEAEAEAEIEPEVEVEVVTAVEATDIVEATDPHVEDEVEATGIVEATDPDAEAMDTEATEIVEATAVEAFTVETPVVAADTEDAAWEELSLEDLQADHEATAAAAGPEPDALPPTAPEPLPAPALPRRSRARRKAPAKPWERIKPSKGTAAARRVRGVEASFIADEDVDAPTVDDEVDASSELAAERSALDVDLDGPLPHFTSWDDVVAAETDTQAKQMSSTPPPVRSIDEVFTPFAPPTDALNVLVSRWKTARLGEPLQPAPVVEKWPEEAPTPAPRGRKQAVVHAGPRDVEGTAPTKLSARGRMMYAAMNNGVDPELMHGDETEAPSRGLRKVMTFAVIAGIIGYAAMHYAEITTWVDTHINLPSTGGSDETPHKGGKNSPGKGQDSKSDSSNEAPKGASVSTNR